MPKTKSKPAEKVEIKKSPDETIYTKDEFGKDILLGKFDLQLMMEWEKPHKQDCIEFLKPFGNVLEIGYGLGYTSDQIQKHNPKSHTIVECDPTVIEKAKNWAKKHKNVKIVEGFWQTQLPKLGRYDCIFFDALAPIPTNDEESRQVSMAFYQNSLEEAQTWRDALADALQQYRNVKFTDSDLEAFEKVLLKKPDVTLLQVTAFIDTLVKQGNINKDQKVKFLADVKKKNKNLQKAEKKISVQDSELSGNVLIRFALQCLEYHMNAGSRLCTCLGLPQPKWEIEEFEKFIYSRKDVKYEQKDMKLKVPANCHYFKGDKALALVIQKLDL